MDYMNYMMASKDLNGSKKLSAPEDSYLYSSSSEMSPPVAQNSLGGDDMAAQMGTSATSGAMMGGPVGAGVAVGGQFLMNYMAQKAADERARRDRAVQIENQYAQNQNKGFDTMMNAFRGALR